MTKRIARLKRLLAATLALGVLLAAGAARGAECNGDECQAPPPAPQDPTPGTAVVEGPPNPPVHFPKVPPASHHRKRSRHRHRNPGNR